MNKLVMVLGVAAVAVVAGCKDPDYVGRNARGQQDEVKNADATTDNGESDLDLVVNTPPANDEQKQAATAETDKATPPAEAETTIYIVQRGDYLAKISKRFNIKISKIKELNDLKSDKIRIGQKLKLPGKLDVGEQKMPETAKNSSTKKATKYEPYTGATTEYVVKSGDYLGSIAGKYRIKIRQLKELNNLKNDNIRVGQKLKVPARDVEAAEPPQAEAKPVAESKPVMETAVDAPLSGSNPAENNNAAESAPAADLSNVPATFEYTVKDGEDITQISMDFEVAPAKIRELNGLGEADQLKAGQIIKLPTAE